MPVVRHQHQRAFELGQRHRQRFARLEVQMVCRLVEQQEIGSLPHDERERQACFFTAREMLDRAGRHVAGEIEAAEIVAQLLLARLRRQAHEVPQRRLVVAQHLDLVLREIADGESLVHHRGSVHRRQHSGNRRDPIVRR